MKKENIIICLLLLPAILVLFTLAFEWTIVDIVSPFLIGPVNSAVWWLLLLSTSVSVILLFSGGRARKQKFYLPILAFAGTLFCAEFVPFTRIALDVDFRVYKSEREKIAENIFSGKLSPNVSYNQSLIALPWDRKFLSAGGGEVEFLHFGQASGVYFFTFRGILGRSTGYLFMNSDPVPSAEDMVEIKKVAPRWFLVQTE